MDRILQIALYVSCLFFFWSLAPLLLLLLGLPLARKLGIIANLRGYATLAVPMFAAFERILTLFEKLLFPIAFIVVLSHGKQGFPAIGSPDRLFADRIFGYLFVLYIGAILPISFGLPLVTTARRLQPALKSGLTYLRWSFGVPVGLILFNHPGWFGWVGALCGIVYGGILGWATIRAVAWTNFNQTPAVRVQSGREGGEWYFLHLSDVHATFPTGSEPAGGGYSGSASLASLAESLIAKKGTATPRLLLDTGDIVDRGREAEWDEPLQSLRRIRDEAGVRVVLTPGNHDLVPTYDFSSALWSVAGKRFTLPEMDGARLLKYFSIACELEPELVTCQGESLTVLVEAEKRRLSQLLAAWDSARDTANRNLNTTGTGHAWAMKRMHLQDPSVADQIAQDFAAQAHNLFPEWNETEWRTLLFASSPKQMEWGIPYRIWDQRWYELFPLRLHIPKDSVEIFILNSIAKEARLAGSARGLDGPEQLERLKQLLSETEARVVIVLHHHAPFRFPVEKGESSLQRWAMLAHDSEESGALANLLTAAVTPEKQVMLLSGHIHMRSRTGQLDTSNASQPASQAVWVMESGALGEPITDVLCSGWITNSGFIEPRLIPRASVTSKNGSLA